MKELVIDDKKITHVQQNMLKYKIRKVKIILQKFQQIERKLSYEKVRSYRNRREMRPRTI